MFDTMEFCLLCQFAYTVLPTPIRQHDISPTAVLPTEMATATIPHFIAYLT